MPPPCQTKPPPGLSLAPQTDLTTHTYTKSLCGLPPLWDGPHCPSALSDTLHPFTTMPWLQFMDFYTASVSQLPLGLFTRHQLPSVLGFRRFQDANEPTRSTSSLANLPFQQSSAGPPLGSSVSTFGCLGFLL